MIATGHHLSPIIYHLSTLSVSSFSDNQKDLVFEIIRQFDATELKTTYPSGHFYIQCCIQYIPKHICLFCRICISRSADELVQLFIIVVF